MEAKCSSAECIPVTTANLTLKSWIKTRVPSFFPAPSRPKRWFSKTTNPNLLGWHNAPRKQWCITLAGSVDIGIGDGTVKTFKPGDAFLAEDVTGQGHTALPKNWVRAFVHL